MTFSIYDGQSKPVRLPVAVEPRHIVPAFDVRDVSRVYVGEIQSDTSASCDALASVQPQVFTVYVRADKLADVSRLITEGWSLFLSSCDERNIRWPSASYAIQRTLQHGGFASTVVNPSTWIVYDDPHQVKDIVTSPEFDFFALFAVYPSTLLQEFEPCASVGFNLACIDGKLHAQHALGSFFVAPADGSFATCTVAQDVAPLFRSFNPGDNAYL